MATAPTAPITMSKEAFHLSHEFLALTERQKVWVDSFVNSQNAAQATRTAYGENPDEAYLAMLTRKIETSPRVIAALDLYFARSPRDRFIRDLQNDIAKSNGIARINARALYAKVTGLIPGAPAEPESRFNIGDIATLDGKQYRVTAIHEDGTVSEADPL